MISGNIESLVGGFLRGWAANIGSPETVEVAVLNEKGMLIGKGVADEYREDLEQNNINNGHHGFTIAINSELLKNGSQITLKEFSKNQDIVADSYSVNSHDSGVIVTIEGIEDNRLVFNLCQIKPRIGYIFCFRIKKDVFAYYKIEKSSAYIFDSVELPIKYLQGEQHVVEVYQNQEPLVQFAGIIKSNAYIPFYLVESQRFEHSNTQYLMNDSRYESLSLQLKHSDETNQKVEDIKVALSTLQNNIKMKEASNLSLPNYTDVRVSIVIYCDNNSSSLVRLLASIILAYNETKFEVIVIDDTCTEDTNEVFRNIKNLVVVSNSNKVGYVKSCNAVAKNAKGQYLLFLNSECELCSYSIDELLRPMLENESIGMTGAKLLKNDGKLYSAGGILSGNGETFLAGSGECAFKPEWNYQRSVDFLTHHAICIRKEQFLEVDYFSEEFEPVYYSDVDLSIKLQCINKSVVYSPFSRIFIHENTPLTNDVENRRKEINAAKIRTKWFSFIKIKPIIEIGKVDKYKDTRVHKRILVIDYATPNLGVDAGSYAAIQEMKLIQALGYKVTFVPETLGNLGKSTVFLQKLGIEVLNFPFYSSVEDVLNRRLSEMDAVYITRYTVAKNYLDQIQTAGKVVLFNNADLHFLREIRAAHLTKNDEEIKNAWLTREEELTVCKKVDAVLTYSKTEQAVIASHSEKAINFFTTPWILEEKNEGPAFDLRNGITFLGGYGHKPNKEAIHYLVNEIMPLLYKTRPEIMLHVYGSNMPEYFKGLECENVRMLGYVDNLDDVYHQHKVFVVPLISGAGIKGKVLDALAYKLPCVLTDVAVEGTGITHGVTSLIANNPEEWVEHIIRLYDDEELWTLIRQNEGLLAKENYSFDSGKKRFKRIFETLCLL